MTDNILRSRQTIVDEVDSRAAFLGLATVRRLPLRTHDLAKFGPTTRSFLFIHIPKLPFNYLVLVLTEGGFRFALISVVEGSDVMQSWLEIEELGWLDKSAANGDWGAAQSPRMGGEMPPPFG